MQIDINERIFHFKQPAGTSRGVYHTRRSWFVTVTDGSRKGVGECAPLPALSCDDVADYEHILRCVCDETARSGRIDTEKLRPFPSMLFGLETAFAMLNSTDGRLFDTPFSRGEQGIPINGLVWMGSFDEMLARIDEKLRLGFRCIKLKIGAIDFAQELEMVRQIRRSYSRDDVEIRLDANGGFPNEVALSRLEELSRYDIHSIEQPVRQNQWAEMARLCSQSPIPIALDEELIGVNDMARKVESLETIRPRYIILKPSLHGGISGATEWVALARERGIGSWLTSALESNVGLAAIAQLAAHLYGSHLQMPQGLGTGQLFTDNVPAPIEIRGDKLWFTT